MYSAEDIDKLGIISGITYREDQPVRAQHSGYLSLVSRINYRIFPKLNLFAKGMYETAEVRKSNGLLLSGKYRTTWGYQGGIEYYPMKENLHFFPKPYRCIVSPGRLRRNVDFLSSDNIRYHPDLSLIHIYLRIIFLNKTDSLRRFFTNDNTFWMF